MSVPHSMEATSAAEVRHVSFARRAKPNGWWAMAILIATEATLFSVLIAVYFYLRFKAVHWPPPGSSEPKPVIPLILMGVLVTTSAPMWVASSAVARGRLGTARLALFVALFVGSGYLAMQMHRFLGSIHAAPPQDGAYSSIVTVLTGGHHAHVLVGLLLDIWLLWRLAGGLTTYRAIGVQAAALYWHFVNVLAVAVTATVLSASL